MRSFGAALLVASLVVTSAMATTTGNTSAPLAPGKAAGVKQAQAHGTLLWWLAGLGVVGLGVGLVASGNGNNSVTPATTTTAP